MATKKKSSLLKKLSLLFLSLFILTLIILALLPTLLSSQTGKRGLLPWINTQIAGTIEAKSIQLSWLNHQQIKGLKLYDPDNNLVVAVDSIDLKTGLLSTISSKTLTGLIIENPTLNIQLNKEGRTNLESLFKKKLQRSPTQQLQQSPQPTKKAKSKRSFSIPHSELEVINGSLSLTTPDTSPFKAKNIHFHFKSQPNNETITLNAHGETGYEDQAGEININLESCREECLYSFLEITITNFPNELIDTFLAAERRDMKKPFKRILGPNLNANLNYNQKDGIVTFNFDINEGKLQLETSLQKIDGNSYKLLEPLRFDTPIDPSLLAALKILPKNIPSIEAPFSLSFTLNPGEVNLHPFYLLENAIEGEIAIDRLLLTDRKRVLPLDLEEIKAHWKFDGKEGEIELDLTSRGAIGKAPYHQKGTLSLLLNLTKWKNGNRFNFSSSKLNLTASSKEIPINRNEMKKSPLPAIFGEKLNIELTTDFYQLNGPFDLSVQSPNCTGRAEGVLSNNHLLLRKELYAELTLTETVADSLLKRVNPLLITAIRSNSPIKLTIEKEGFSLPLRELSFSNLLIANAKLDLGKITMGTGSHLGLLLDLLQSGSLKGSESVDVWFTPQHFSIHKGVITSRRMDALVGNAFHIASWGVVNTQSKAVDFYLAITGDALRKAFALKNIRDDDAVIIPIKGTVNSPTIDSKEALKQISKVVIKGQEGVNGSLVDNLMGLFKNEKKKSKVELPPPTTTPFPWNDGSKKEEPEIDQPPTKKDNKKKIEKEVKKFLKSL